MNLKEKIDFYLGSPEVSKLSETSIKYYRYSLKSLADFYPFDEVDFDEIIFNKAFMNNFTEALEKKGKRGVTIQDYVNCVKIFLKWCSRPIEYTYKVPSHERKKNKRKQMRRWFNEHDIAMCLNYFEFSTTNEEINLRNKIIVRLLIETGARVSEMANVKAQDIDIEERIVMLNDSKTEPRPAYFSPECQEMLKSLRQSKVMWKEDVFPGVRSVMGMVTEMLADLGLKRERDGRGPHTFRHYTASHLFYIGNMRIEDVAFLLGDTVDTIITKYLHPTPLMLRERVDKAMKWDV